MPSGDEFPDFTEFANSGAVEVGTSNAAPAANPPIERPADTGAAGGEGDDGNVAGGEGDDGNAAGGEGADDQVGDGTEGEAHDGKETPDGYLKRLRRERAAAREEARQLKAQLAAVSAEGIEERIIQRLQNGGLPPAAQPANSVPAIGPSPDPNDQAKYPLGHLDAQYVEDRMAWLVQENAAKQADAALQRQQEQQRNQSVQQEQQRVLQTVKTLSDKGAEIYDDFQEKVVNAGMKGAWDLSQPTFEAAAEVDHGPAILYELASNPTEATRVAKLSPRQQILYVEKRNSEIAEKAAARKIPGAGAPPTQQPRGGNSRTKISPATDNLDDFEKAWEADAKGKR